MLNSLIFIKEDLQLVIEITPVARLCELNNGLLFCLTQYDGADAPLCLTTATQQNVISFLKTHYEPKNKRINKLIAFFRQMKVGNYFYIYPYGKDCDELYDLLQYSLRWYNQKLSEEEIKREVQEYFETMENMQELFQRMGYRWQPYVPDSKKMRFGEMDKKKRVCIYCKGSMLQKTASFIEDAHAIPEAIGNISFFQNEECDRCNSYFANHVEEDLVNWLVMSRVMCGIRGKNGYPVFQFDHQIARHINTEKMNFEADWGKFESVKSVLKERAFCGVVMMGKEKLTDGESLYVTYEKKYKPQHLYKALVKCVIGVIPKEELTHFQKTIHWLRYEEDEIRLPKVLIFNNSQVCMQPQLYLFIRREEDYSMPYCFGELRTAEKIFVFIVPFSDGDRNDFSKRDLFYPYLCKISNLYKKPYQLWDFSSTEDTPLVFQITKFNK